MKKFTSKSILISGGAGFIGSHLCEKLLVSGNRLVVIDDLSSGKEENIKDFINDIEFYCSKVEEFDLSKLNDIDFIINLSAQTSAPKSIVDFKESSKTNLLSLLNLMNFSKGDNIPIVFSSSAAVYGNLEIADDSKNIHDLLSPYAVDKFVSELYLKNLHELHGVPSISLRFFNVYGPRQDPNSTYSGVISKFVHQIINGEEVTIYGGEQTRDFVFVEDVVNAIIKSLQVLSSSDSAESINVLTTQTISINHLFQTICTLLGRDVKPKYMPRKEGDPNQSNGTSLKLEKVLGIDKQSFRGLKDGLLEVIKYNENLSS